MEKSTNSHLHAPKLRLSEARTNSGPTGSVLSALRSKVSEESARYNDWLSSKEKSVTEIIKEKLGDLKYPDGFFPNNIPKDSGNNNALAELRRFPGGLSMPSIDAKTYFGTEARMQFFERQHSLQRQRSIFSTETSAAFSPNAHDILKDKPTNDNYAFQPIRIAAPVEVSVSTNVIIRTQTLTDDPLFDSQMRLKVVTNSSYVPKSARLSAEDHHIMEAMKDVPILRDIPEYEECTEYQKSNKAEQKMTPKVRPKSQYGMSSPSPGHGHQRENKRASSANLYLNRQRAEPKGGDFAGHQTPTAAHLNKTRTVAFKTTSTPTHNNSNILNHNNNRKKSLRPTTDTVTHDPVPGNLSPTPKPREDFQQYTKSIFLRNEGSHKLDFDMNQSEDEPIQLVRIEKRHSPKQIEISDNFKHNRLLQYVEEKQSKLSMTSQRGMDTDMDGDMDSVTSILNSLKNAPSIISRPESPRNKKKREKRHQKVTPEEFTPSSGDLSPRSRYIDGCIRKKLNPRLSLILRKSFTKCLDLQHQGIGDEMAILFADAIVDIPYVESLNIADNNLTDKGLAPIIKALSNMSDLIDLNMSYNTIGPNAAASLLEYMASPKCSLVRLTLRRADVDDLECERIISSLRTNRSLTDLDLSENLIGSHEQLNTVFPDITTGTEALAELLSSPLGILETLKLGNHFKNFNFIESEFFFK